MDRDNKRLILLLVLLGVAVFVVYIPAIDGGFIWDDDSYVQENKRLREDDSLAKMWSWSQRYDSLPQWYPLVHTTFRWEYQAWGLNPVGYHVNNILLHIASTVLLVFVLRRLGVRSTASLVVAAVFALHPVMVESVAWVTERKNVLSLFLYLASLYCWLRYDPLDTSDRPPSDDPRSSSGSDPQAAVWRHGLLYVSSLVLFVAALLSKSVTCSLPAAILLLIYWKNARIDRQEVVALMPFFAVGLWLALNTADVERVRVGAVGPEWDLSLAERVLVAGRAIWFYAYKLVWPAELVFIYERWQLDSGALWQWLFPVGVAAILVGLFVARHRIGRGPLVAVCIFCGTLTPALGFFDVYPMRYSFVADHFQYHASIALITLLVVAVVGVFRRAGGTGRRIGWPVALLVLAVLGARTFWQSRIYQGLEELYSSILRSVPDSWFAHNNIASVYTIQSRDHQPGSPEARRKIDLALKHFARAKAINPNLDQAGNKVAAADVSTRAFALMQTGTVLAQSVQSIAHQIDPSEKRARLQAASEFFKAAIELEKDYKTAHMNRAGALGLLGNLDEAVLHARQVLRIDQKDNMARIQLAGLQFQLANMRAQQGKAADAERAMADALKNLGTAITKLEHDLSQDPKDRETRGRLFLAHVTMGRMFRSKGRERDAQIHFQAAERIRSDPNR